MIELFIFGLFLGWGAAIPIGAINLEIIRRNLNLGTSKGSALGLGACSADVTYLVLLSCGMLQILNSPTVLKTVGCIGSLVLMWFGFLSLNAQTKAIDDAALSVTGDRKTTKLLSHFRDGYLLTLVNPYSIIFWASVSLTIAAKTSVDYSTVYAGIGVLVGTLSWVMSLNFFLHKTKHKISENVMRKINIVGGLILIGFGIAGLYRAFV